MIRSRLMLLSLTAAMVVAFGSHSAPAWSRSGNTEVTLLSSSAIQGELAPCG